MIAVIDLETTGFDPAGNSIIELGVVLVTPAGDIHDTFSSLVKPQHPISFEAMAVHHITEDMVADAPSLTEALLRASARLKDNTPSYFVAHNAKFEAGFLPWLTPWVCTWRVAAHVWPDAPARSNGVLRYWLPGLNDEVKPLLDGPAHRALADALVTAFILKRLLAVHSIDELAALSEKPIIWKTASFGMHRGKPWSEIPSDYLSWLLKQSDLDADTRATALHHLEQRKEKADV
jgi:exodeoxyribonuclease X